MPVVCVKGVNADGVCEGCGYRRCVKGVNADVVCEGCECRRCV